MKQWVIVIVLTVFMNELSAQTGPGGVGDRTGTSSLEIWMESQDLDGDDIFTDNPVNGTGVQTWTDKSGNGNNLVQATAANRPTYNTTGTFNAVNFVNTGAVGTLDYMNFTNTMHLIPGSVFFVLLPTDGGFASNTLLDDATRSLRLEQYNNTNVLGYTRYGVLDYTTSINPAYGSHALIGFHKTDANNNLEVRQNDETETISIGTTGSGIPLLRMGALLAADGANYNCIEIIAYSTLLNSAQIRIVENYLSAKYGSITILNDQFTMDNPGNGNHDYDMAGIGRISVSNTHTDAQSNIVRINTPSSLGNGDFLYWGHNNGILRATEVSDVPSPVLARFERVWGINEAGNIGTVRVEFDLTGHTPVTASDLRLIIDTDNDGVFNEPSTTIISGATDVGGNLYRFTGVNFANGTRFTLGTINPVQTPLPVELISFKASVEDHAVLLSWETASEYNSESFTLERSKNGLDFKELKKVKAAGHSQSKKKYTERDHTPPYGLVYYRLKQTDIDGSFEYVGVVSAEVNFEIEPSVYPNPVSAGERLTVRMPSESSGIINCQLINPSGRSNPVQPKVLPTGELEIIIPEDLAEGLYMFIITSSQMDSPLRKKILIIQNR